MEIDFVFNPCVVQKNKYTFVPMKKVLALAAAAVLLLAGAYSFIPFQTTRICSYLYFLYI